MHANIILRVGLCGFATWLDALDSKQPIFLHIEAVGAKLSRTGYCNLTAQRLRKQVERYITQTPRSKSLFFII